MFKHSNRARRAGNSSRKLAAKRAIHRSVQAGWETLEPRVLMSNSYLINGTQLSINGGQASTFVSPLTLTGSGNTVTVQNFAGAATVNGAGGGDAITIDAGGGGTIAINDANAVLQVVAPTTRAANVTAIAGQITLTSGDVVTYGSNTASVSLAGQLFSNGDALTINGSGGSTIAVGSSSVSINSATPTLYYNTFNSLTVNGAASDNFTVSGDSITTTLNAGTGNVNFNVSTNSVALTLNGGSDTGTNSFTINSNSGQFTATGGNGNNSFTVFGSSSSMTLTGGAGANTFTIQSNSASLNINGQGTANTVVVNGNSSSITARGGTGSTDSFTINSTTGQVGLVGGVGSTTTYLISAPTIAAVTVTGSTTGTNALTFDGTALNNAFSISTNAVSAGSGAAVGFTHLTALTVNGIGGNDSFLVNADTVSTTLNGGAGNDTFNIQSESGGISVSTGTGTSTVNLGSNAPLTSNNTLAGLAGAVTVIGDNADTVNLNDAADTISRTMTMTNSSITGLGFAGLTYSGLATLNVKLGSGGNTAAIISTAAGTTTNFNAGAGANSLALGTTNSSSGVLTNFAGPLNLTGSGTDNLVLNDAGDSLSLNVIITPTTVTGLSPAPIGYANDASLTVNLGTAGNSVAITNTHAGTNVFVNGGIGNDNFKIVADASPVALTTGGGADVLVIQSIGAATSITSAGNSTVDVGSLAPATGGVLSTIAAGLTFAGSSTDTLNIDDSGNQSANTSTLSATALHGLGMNSSGISYSGLSNLNLTLGAASDTVTISNTAVGTNTNITTGAAADNITLVADSSPTTISGGAGNDHINIQTTNAVTTVNTGSGAAVVYVGNNAPATPSTTTAIGARLTINGGGNTTIDLDDTGDNVSKSPFITSGFTNGISGNVIVYSGFSALNIMLGSGGNSSTVVDTQAGAITTINTGAGNDTTKVIATSGTTNINNGSGVNTVNVGSNAPFNNSNTTLIAGALNLIGNASASDTLNLLNAADTLPRVMTMTPTTLTGMSPATISYTGYSMLNVYMGTANSALTVSNTMTGATLIDTGSGSDNVTIQHDSGPTTLQGSNSNYYIQNAAALTGVNALAFDQVTIGNPVGVPRTLAGITATVVVNGNSTSSLLVDDSADTSSKTGTLTGTAINNLSTGVINYTNVSTLNVNLGTAGNTLGVLSTSAPTTVTGGAGADIINVQSDSAAVTVAAGLGANVVNIGSNAPAIHGNVAGLAAPVTVTGTGVDTLNIDDTGDATTRTFGLVSSNSVTGLGGSVINYSGQTALNLSLGNASDGLFVIGTAVGTATTVHTGNVGTIVNARATAGTLTVQSNAADTINVGSNAPATSLMSTINANVTVTGLGNDTLNIDDNADVTNATGTVGATAVTGFGATGAVNYTGVSQLNVNLGVGNNAVTVNGTSTSTAINGTTSNTLSVLNTSSATTITSPGTVIIGSVNTSGGTIANITGPVTITGDNTDSLIIQDVADTTARTGTLSATQLTLGPAVVNYTGQATLAINLGSGGDTFTINNTASTTPVTLNGGIGTDVLNIVADSSNTTVNAGSATSNISIGSPTHIIDGLIAPLTITGTGTNPLNINDTGSTIAKTGTITDTTVTGFNTAGIAYSGLGTLNVLLGSGGNTVLVSNTAATTVTTLNAGAGNDTVNVTNTSGITNINGQAGNDAINIQATSAVTNINNGTGTNTVNVGSLAPLFGGITTNITGALNIAGNSAELDTLNLLDDADANNDTAALTATTMTGISPATITYNAFSNLNLYMGPVASSLTVSNTMTGNTVINTGTGSDNIIVQHDSGPTQVQVSNSLVTVQNIAAATEIDSVTPNLITVGSPVTGGHTLAGINATLTLDGAPGSNALIDDSIDGVSKTGALTSNALTGLSTGAIDYLGLASLSVRLGSAGNTLSVTSTSAPTTLTGGAGADVINVQSDSAPLTIALRGGHNTVNIGSSAPATGGVLANVASPVTVTGTGIDTLNLDDTGDTNAQTATFTATAITGLGNASINYTGQTALNLSLGNATDTLNVTGTAAGTASTVHTGIAGTTVNIRATSGAITLNSGAADTVNVGSNAPAASMLTTLNAPITVNGLGTDTLNVSDAADTTNATGQLGNTALTGLGTNANINYAGLSNLNLSLGTGNNNFTVNGTTATTAITGTTANTISIAGTTAFLAISSPGTITMGGNVGSLTGPISITGDGTDTLVLTDTADSTARTGTLSPTQLTLGPANVSYSNAATLAIALGTGGDNFTINDTATITPVTLTGGSGNDTLTAAGDSSNTTIIAGSNAGVVNVGNAGVLDGLNAPLTVTGSGSNTLNINDTDSTIAKTGSMNGTDVSGLNTSGIHYTGIGQLNIALGSGGNLFMVGATAVPTAITAGNGHDLLLLTDNTQDVNGLAAPVTVNGGGNAQLTVNDGGSTAAKTLQLTQSNITGLSPAAISYSGLGGLTINLGSGHDAANIQGSSAAATTVNGNAAGENFNVTAGSLFAPITLAGNGSDPLVMSDSTDTAPRNPTFAPGLISGMGGPVSYTGMSTLAVTLGNAGDTAIVNGVDPVVPTTIDGGAGSNTATINIHGDLPGHLTLKEFQTGSVTVTGNLTGTVTTDGSLSNLATGGSLTGTLNVSGGIATASIGADLSGNLTTGGSIATIGVGGNLAGTLTSGTGITNATVNGNLSGTLTTPASVSALTINGNLSGTVTAGGDINSLHVKGGFLSTGTVNVTGALKLLELDGTDAGQSNVGSLEGLVVSNVTPTADGTIFSLTQNGVTRSIQALAANQTTGFTGTTFSTVYDDSTGVPQAAVRVNGGTASQRFDLILNAPATDSFSLSRLDSGNNSATQVRNVVINGSLLAGVTAAEAGYFGYAANTPGGVMLPNDNLAAVSARDVMAPGTLYAKTIQGIGYSTLLGSTGEVHSGSRVAVSNFKEKLLLSTLVLNPKTHKAYTTVAVPTETLLVPAGTIANKTALYAGHAGGLPLDTNGVIVWDRDAGQFALAGVTLTNKAVNGEQVINNLAWQGTGGSVQTLRVISNISSTGPIGDVLLGAGKFETLQSLTAPSVEGTINLYGGKLVGTLQTTSGNLGSADGSSQITGVQMTSTAQILSRGNLFSSVSVTGNLAGTIAADNDIAGDIVVTGKGASTGSVIAFGSVTGPVTIEGSFSGQLAAGSTNGIQGNVTIARGIAKGGSVVSNGNIGNSTTGTQLSTSTVKGVIVANGNALIHTVNTKGNSTVVESSGPGQTATILAEVFSPAGTPLEIDQSPDDQAGLKQLKAELKTLAVNSTGALT